MGLLIKINYQKKKIFFIYYIIFLLDSEIFMRITPIINKTRNNNIKVNIISLFMKLLVKSKLLQLLPHR